jgi:Domain of unknown function (DUF4286)
MLLYNVTVKIDNNVHESWLTWMKNHHIPDVMATGCFIENRICRILDQDDSEGLTYAFQYLAKTTEDYQRYQKEFAPEMQKDHRTRYEGKFVAFRTLMEVVG